MERNAFGNESLDTEFPAQQKYQPLNDQRRQVVVINAQPSPRQTYQHFNDQGQQVVVINAQPELPMPGERNVS